MLISSTSIVLMFLLHLGAKQGSSQSYPGTVELYQNLYVEFNLICFSIKWWILDNDSE